jgi:hypothetical protein
MDLMIPCKRAAELMVAREDRALTWGEGAALRVHLLMCKACPRFEKQLLTMRQAMSSWRHYTDTTQDPPPPP